MRDLSERLINVVLAADAYTRGDLTDTAALNALCDACEQITDSELADFRVAAEDRAETVRLYGEERVAELEQEANRGGGC